MSIQTQLRPDWSRPLAALEGLGRKLTPEGGFAFGDSGHFTEMSGNFQICSPERIGQPANNPVEKESCPGAPMAALFSYRLRLDRIFGRSHQVIENPESIPV